MKCKNCSVENSADSQFCQECGTTLEGSSREQEPKEKHKSLSDEIEDVIFSPNKKKRNYSWVLFVILFFAVTFLVLIIAGSSTSSEITDNASSTNQETPTENPASYVLLENENLDWIGQDLYYVGTLKNTGSKAIKDVSVRIDFYTDKATTKLFDTRFATIAGAAGKGAFSFQIQLPIYPENNFWWIRTIESASY